MMNFQVPDLDRLTEVVNDTLSVRRAFGEPIEKDGSLIIPVARVSGGQGVGYGVGPQNDDNKGGADRRPDTNDPEGEGGGFGFGVNVKPEGAYVVRDGKTTWIPVIDINRIAFSTMVLWAVAILAGVIVSGRSSS